MSDTETLKRDEFEKYPALASWIERLGNSPMPLSLGEWMIFIGAINNALITASRPPQDAGMRERVARIVDPEMWTKPGNYGMSGKNARQRALAKADAILAATKEQG